MNANELADLNEWSCCAHSKEVSAMLRQQQAEIEALKMMLELHQENYKKVCLEMNRVKTLCISYIDDEWSGTSSYQEKIDEVNNELADELENTDEGSGYLGVLSLEAATMLRQQQAEIKTLEGALAQLKHMNKNWQISENILLLELEKLQIRELTDEEIMDYVDAFSIDMGNVYEFQPDNVLQMIRAILDKAQEK